MEQELLTLPELLSSPTVFSEVPFTRLLVLCACFVARCLSFCPFSFGHCVVCPSSIDPVPETDLEIYTGRIKKKTFKQARLYFFLFFGIHVVMFKNATVNLVFDLIFL